MSTKKRLHVLFPATAALMLTACGDDAGVVSETTPPPVQQEEAGEALTAAQKFRQTTERHAAELLSVSPELATALGVSEDLAGEGYLSRLGGYGFAASQRAREMNESFLQELRDIDRDELEGETLVHYDVLTNAYRTAARRNQFDFGGASEVGSGRPNSGDAWSASPYLVTQMTGPHLYLPRMLQTEHPLETRANVESYIDRLGEMGRVFDETIETIRADAGLGVVPPEFVLAGAINAIEGLTDAPPAEHPLVTTLEAKMGGIGGLSDEQQTAFVDEAVLRMENVVYPAYARLAATLESLKAQTGPDAGIWRLGEEGEAYYQFTLDAYGGGGMTAGEIHALGLSEVARITEEMDAILRSIDLENGSVSERMQQLAAREENRFPNTEEGRAELLSLLRRQVEEVNALAPDWFGRLPESDVEVRRIPVYEQDSAAGGYYTSAPLDGSRPGIYWINLKDTADVPVHTLRTLTHHEAVPGHHFQISLQQEQEGMPLIRNMLSYSEYTEGWALYAEKLAKEMGLYDGKPKEDLGRLQAEIFRAARLVVDSGLHAKKWTRQQAIDYMVSATGESRASVTREIERYAAIPGQATSYKLGMLKIGELREEAEAALGDKFDVRSFHDVVLSTGAAPLPVLEANVDRWVEGQQG